MEKDSYPVDSKWNMTNTKLLIELYKEKRELWDTECADFKNREQKRKAWEELAAKLKLDRYDVERKARSLAGQFQRELKKYNDGANTEGCSKWFAFKSLMFLYNKQSQTKPRVEADTNINKPKCDPIIETVTGSKLQTKGKRPNYVIIQPKPTKKSLLTAKTPIQPTAQPRDDYNIFGDYIASKLRNLQDPFVVNTIQNQICNIIYEAEVRKSNPAYATDICGISNPRSFQSPEQNTSVAESEEDIDGFMVNSEYPTDDDKDIKIISKENAMVEFDELKEN